MNNSLIKTDGLWYKIKQFFGNMFSGDKYNSRVEIKEDSGDYGNIDKTNNIVKNDSETKESFKTDISYKEEIKEQNRKEIIAAKLLNGDIDSYDLSNEEVNEMTEYFMNDIEKQNKELQRIKERIIQMKKQLEE